ncbi:MAG TPA: DPP IV N-terminal domain-containing protein [Spirochaetia bacterium]
MNRNWRRLTVSLVGLAAACGMLILVSGCESMGGTSEAGSNMFAAGRGGYTADLDEPSTRGLIKRVTPADFHVSWRFDVSPDGQKIVFSGYQSAASPVMDLWVVPATGGVATKITSGTTDGMYSPSFTADGQHIVYESAGSLWMIRSDGAGGKRKIPGSGVGQDVNPDVNKDNILVFTSVQQKALTANQLDYQAKLRAAGYSDDSVKEQMKAAGMPVERTYVVWTSTLDGGSLTQLREGTYPRWSPDGTHIVFVHQDDIWSIKADGTELTQLTSTKDIQEGLPSYSADGKSICFVSNEAHQQGETESYNVFVMNVDGSNKTQVTELNCWNSWPLLTQDGLYFLSGRANDPAAEEKYTRIWGVSKADWLH